MSQQQHNPELDQFISSKLKNLEIEFEQQLWLEMEDSLGTQSKGSSIPKINSKYLFTSSVIIIVGTALFFLVRGLFNQSNNAEQETLANSDSVQILQSDSSKIISVPSLSFAIDSAAKDTVKEFIVSADTATKTSVLPETTVVKNTTDKLVSEKKSIATKEASKPEKKKTKTSALAPSISDTGFVPEIIPPPDTVQKNPERKSETIPAITDTSKLTPAPKKSGKKGKQKSSPVEQPKVDSNPSVTKPDSLK